MVRFLLALALFCGGTGAAAQAPDIHLREVGEGRRCWVLLHPFGASGRFWERRAAELARIHAVRVVAPDLPGHGRSRLVERFDYRSATRAMRTALRRTCPRPALIVGASSGGIVAMQLGAATGARVVAIGVGRSFSPANLAQMAATAAAPESQRAFFAAYAEQGDAQVAAIGRHFGDLARLGTTPFLTAAEERRLAGRLLVLQGDRDDFFRPDSAARLAGSVPGARLVWFAGADHLGPLAQPNAARLWALVGEAGLAARD